MISQLSKKIFLKGYTRPDKTNSHPSFKKLKLAYVINHLKII